MNLLLSVVLTLSIFHIYPQDLNDCEKFKEGTFEMYSEEIGRIEIVRKKNFQFEKHFEDGITKKSKWKIEWTADCEYDLILVKPPKNETSDMLGKRLHVRITAINGDEYEYASWMDDIDLIVDGKISKIK